MYRSAILYFFICQEVLSTASQQFRKFPVVSTKYGRIRGVARLSRDGRPYYSFTKIPYAQPPVGENRFKPPMYLAPWDDILDGQEETPPCIQKNYFASSSPPAEGVEDCLYLNVYTPKLPSQESRSVNKKLPVMVFIHWGGFIAGYTNTQYLGPEYFMDEDIVLVTINYRLGVMGFLSTDDDVAPGNWGLKDQVAALRWVRMNSEFFSGDKSKVTIFGQSAGAGSVHYHLLSPLTKHLFHRAISQSGSALNLWAQPMNKIQALVTRNTATFVGCDNDTDTATLVGCLRKIPAKELVEASDKFKYFDVEPLIVYGPVTERKTLLNPRPYITKPPSLKLLHNEFQNVPWMVGVVEEEGILRAAPLLRSAQKREQLNAAFDSILPQSLVLPLSVNTTQVDQVWSDIKKFYWGGANRIDIENSEQVKGFIDMYSDRAFTYGVYQSVLAHAAKGHTPIWFYNFNYKGVYSYANYFADTDENINFNWGTSHCDDLVYLFRSPALFPDLPANSSDITMSKIMVKLWVNFATYGNPTPDYEIKDTVWEQMADLSAENEYLQSHYLRYLNITGTFNIRTDDITLENKNCFIAERMKFMESLPLKENIKHADQD